MDYSKHTIKALQLLCKEQNRKGFSNKNKDQLIQLLTAPIVVPEPAVDTYTPEVLKEQYGLHKEYVMKRKESSARLGVVFRLPCIPEDISENIVKFIIHKNGDTTSRWNCAGDLLSDVEGKQECKCFTSEGPLSFTPSSEWNAIYFLDARAWMDDRFTLHKVTLKKTDDLWKNIKMSKTQTFEDQCQQGRRPRITWDGLRPQVPVEHCTEVFNGTFSEIFL